MKTKHITDRQLLKWIESGEIVITKLDTRRPVLHFRGREHTPTIVESRGQNHHGGSPRHRWELMSGYTRTGKLTRKQVLYIRKHCIPLPCGQPRKGIDTSKSLSGMARKFGVKPSSIKAIINKQNWNWL